MATKTVQLGKGLCKDYTKDKIEQKIGRSLANPINARKEGETFEATLTGEIVFSQYGDRKSAHLTTNEGYKIAVPANFDKNTHKKDAKVNCVCMVAEVTDDSGKERSVKYTSIVM